MIVVKVVFWAALGLLAWTLVGYPLATAAVARMRPRRVRKGDVTPSVTIIVPAYNEEAVIARRLDNLLELDYPAEHLAVVVTSDGSSDRTDEIVQEYAARDSRIRLRRFPRSGKLPMLNQTVAELESEIVGFTDANTVWASDALRSLMRNFADDDVAYVTGKLTLQSADGINREGVYWRYELWLRENESTLGSITGGNGAIYAIRRSDYFEPPFGHDLSFPPLTVKRGRRAVYEPEAAAFEKPSAESAEEYKRKVRMLPWNWAFLVTGKPLRGVPAIYAVEIFSHRHLRYGSGLLHVVLLATNIALLGQGLVYQVALGLQVLWLALAAIGRLRLPVPGAAIAHYYLLMMTATIASLFQYIRRGPSLTWEKAAGTR